MRVWMLFCCFTCFLNSVHSFGYSKKPWSKFTGPIGPMGRMDWEQERRVTNVLMNLTKDIIVSSNRRIRGLWPLRLQIMYTAPFEVGYMACVIQEKYRKMVDRYNVTRHMGKRLSVLEHIIYLEEVEALYFDLEHLIGMQHEIERKYRVRSGLYDPWVNPTTKAFKISKSKTAKETASTSGEFMLAVYTSSTKRNKLKIPKTKEEIEAWQATRWARKKNSTRWWWPTEYGWEIDYWWGPTQPTVPPSSATLKLIVGYNSGEQMSPLQKDILRELSWPLKVTFLNDYLKKHKTREGPVDDNKMLMSVPLRRSSNRNDPYSNEIKSKLLRTLFETLTTRKREKEDTVIVFVV